MKQHHAVSSLRASAMLVVSVIGVGVMGFHFIEGWPLFDAFYMTIITMTTIGYHEVHGLSDAGRAFNVVFIVISVGTVLYVLNQGARMLVEGELKDIVGRRKVRKAIEGLSDHYIVCGYGRMGRIICNELEREGVEFVVVEREDGSADSSGRLVLRGDATKDDVLLEAGIERARGLISVLPTDAENLYVVLSARGMNPGLKIVARAIEEGSDKKLMRAGATRVVSPYHIGGLRIAHTVLKPAVVDFIEFTTQAGEVDLEMEEVSVSGGSSLAGKTLGESGIGRDLGIIIVAMKLADGKLKINPTHDTRIVQGDTLIVIGQEGKLAELEKRAAG